MASFAAAGTASVTHAVNTIPFYLFYSMFGFQRIGDSAWACGDSRCRGFLIGCTAGRTTLAGEGLQHQDGHSHLLGSTIPNLVSYDPAYAFEIAAIVRDGIRRMYHDREPVFYYITVQNEPYAQPPKPDGVDEGILKGLYKFRAAEKPGKKPRVHLFGSASILREALSAQDILEKDFGVAADVWSATSYSLLRREALDCERWNLLHPGQKPKMPYVSRVLADEPFPIVATSDYIKAIPDQIARWVPAGIRPLGTDGFGRSESREALRDYFEINAKYVTLAALQQLAQTGKFDAKKLAAAAKKLGISAKKIDPCAPPTGDTISD